jgi:ADP-heptose:LPS heptosyltransferase
MKILVLRFSSIGDIVLCSPVVRCLRQQLGAEVHFLTKKRFASIVEPNPYIYKVHTFESSIAEVLPALRAERYDWVVDLHKNLRSLQVKTQLMRPSRSFNKLNLEKWLLVNTGINLMPDRHIVHRYMETVAHLGVQYDGEGLDYFIPAEEEIDARALHPSLDQTPFTALVIGATHATKRLPTDRLTELCRQMDTPVVLLGGPGETDAGRQIAGAGPHVIDCCGRLSLHQSASIIRQAARVITHDTGLMHIAAAFRRPIISIWGSTVPAFGMYPFYPDGMAPAGRVEVSGLSCRPCSKIGYDACPKGHFKCMLALDIRQILQPLK